MEDKTGLCCSCASFCLFVYIFAVCSLGTYDRQTKVSINNKQKRAKEGLVVLAFLSIWTTRPTLKVFFIPPLIAIFADNNPVEYCQSFTSICSKNDTYFTTCYNEMDLCIVQSTVHVHHNRRCPWRALLYLAQI